jgi:hypothetical protein
LLLRTSARTRTPPQSRTRCARANALPHATRTLSRTAHERTRTNAANGCCEAWKIGRVDYLGLGMTGRVGVRTVRDYALRTSERAATRHENAATNAHERTPGCASLRLGISDGSGASPRSGAQGSPNPLLSSASAVLTRLLFPDLRHFSLATPRSEGVPVNSLTDLGRLSPAVRVRRPIIGEQVVTLASRELT